MATQIILFGVGRTAWDDERRIQGDLQVPLSQAGEDQVKARLEEIREMAPSAIYAPETLSSAQTADILKQGLKVKVRQQAGLNEVGYGLWQGLLVDEVKNRHPKVFKRWVADPPSVSPPEGEPFDHAFARVAKAVHGIVKKHSGETVVLVCPKAIKVIARCVLTGQQVDRLWDEPSQEGAWEVVEVDE